MSFICEYDRVHRRAGHACFLYKGELVIYGGIIEQDESNPRRPNSTSTNCNDCHQRHLLVICQPDILTWRTTVTAGDIPPRGFGEAWAVSDDILYLFGGHHLYETDRGYVDETNCELYQLNLECRQWFRVEPLKGTAEVPLPCEKAAAVTTDQDLIVFGGYGPILEEDVRCHYHVEFNPHSVMGRNWAWNNGLVAFGFKSRRWRRLAASELKPSPRAGHTALYNSVDGSMWIFGGRSGSGRLGDLWRLHLATLTWNKVVTDGGPSGRSLHTMTRVRDQVALVYGGLSQDCQPLSDAWMLTVDGDQVTWKELDLPYDHGEIRCWHGAAVAPGGRLLLHSGLTQEHYLTRVQLDGHPHDPGGLLTIDLSLYERRLSCAGGIPRLSSLALPQASSVLATMPQDSGYALPEKLAEAVATLANGGSDLSWRPPPASNEEEPFDRAMIHEGS